ncbi:MAG: hypothetical protein AAF921_22100 [Cyanobacteria bacterium P01_D01_bin.44]
MPWITLILFGLAVVSWQFALKHPDDVGRFLGTQSALFCLVAGLIKAPLLLQGAALVGILVSPTCSSKAERVLKPSCPQLCLRRRQCRSLQRF